MKMSNELIRTQVENLYKNYRSEGGFGLYDIDRMCERRVGIEGRIYQEETIKEMYFIVYNVEISQKKLESMYLGRKCMNTYQRCIIKLKYGIPKECICRGEDPFTTFTKRYRVEGFTKRMYWSEKNAYVKRVVDCETTFSKPTMKRTN